VESGGRYGGRVCHWLTFADIVCHFLLMSAICYHLLPFATICYQLSLRLTAKKSNTAAKRWCACDICVALSNNPRGRALATRTWQTHQQEQKVRDIKRAAAKAAAEALSSSPPPPAAPRPSPAPLPSFHALPIDNNDLFDEGQLVSNDWYLEDEVQTVAHSGQ
jgi:hypothetical protein